MVVGVYDAVITLLAAQKLNGTVGNDFVGVHVQRSSGASLDRIHDKVLVELSFQNLIAGLHDRIGNLFINDAHLAVGDGSGLLDICQAVNDLRMHGKTGDMKVLSGS